MDSWLSSNEEIIIPLDFYEPFNEIFDKKQAYTNNNLNNYHNIHQYNSYNNNKINIQQISNNNIISKSYSQSMGETKSIILII